MTYHNVLSIECILSGQWGLINKRSKINSIKTMSQFSLMQKVCFIWFILLLQVVVTAWGRTALITDRKQCKPRMGCFNEQSDLDLPYLLKNLEVSTFRAVDWAMVLQTNQLVSHISWYCLQKRLANLSLCFENYRPSTLFHLFGAKMGNQSIWGKPLVSRKFASLRLFKWDLNRCEVWCFRVRALNQ